jgi:hypothetical protein
MRALSAIAACLRFVLPATAFAQTPTDLVSYCQEMTELSTTTLLARTRGYSRLEVETAGMKGITDPLTIRMIKEVIDFAYSRPAGTNLDALRTELRNLCLAKKIFVQ